MSAPTLDEISKAAKPQPATSDGIRPWPTDELRRCPPTLSIPQTCHWIGISVSHGYQSIKDGTFPVRVIAVGRRYRAVTNDLIRLLEGGDAHA